MRWISRPPRRADNPLETIETFISISQKAIILVAMLSVLVGSLVMVLYCFNLRRIPQDISVNDVFVLLMTAVSFGLIYIVGLFYSVVSNIWLLKALHRWKSNSPKARSPRAALNFLHWSVSLAFFVIFVSAFIQLVTSQSESDQDTSMMMVAFWGGGFFVAIALFFSLSENQKTSQKFGADVRKNLPGITGWLKSGEGLVFAAGAAVPFVFAWAILLNFVMINTGVRAENVALVLNEENLAYITSISKAAGADLKICPIANSRSGLVWPTHLLWHGIGSISYVEITLPNAAGSKKSRSLVIDLDRKGIKPINSIDAVTFSCS